MNTRENTDSIDLYFDLSEITEMRLSPESMRYVVSARLSKYGQELKAERDKLRLELAEIKGVK